MASTVIADGLVSTVIATSSRPTLESANTPVTIDTMAAAWNRAKAFEVSPQEAIGSIAARFYALWEKPASVYTRYAQCMDTECMREEALGDWAALREFALQPISLRLGLTGLTESLINSYFVSKDPSERSTMTSFAYRAISLVIAEALVFGATRITPALGEAVSVKDIIEDAAHIAFLNLALSAAAASLRTTFDLGRTVTSCGK